MRNITTAIEAMKSKPTAIQRLGDRIEAFRRVITSLLLLVLLIILVSIVLTESKDVVAVESFDVPRQLQERGYTAPVVASKLVDQINDITLQAKTRIAVAPVTSTIFQPVSDVEVFGVRASVRSIISYLKHLFGKSTVHINGEVVSSAERLRLTVRISVDNGELRANTQSFEENGSELESIVIPAAAKYILEKIDPYILASYYYELSDRTQCDEDQRNQTELSIKTLQTCFDTGSLIHHDLSEYRKWALTLWGLNLVAQKDYDAALKKYEEALRLAPDDPIVRYNYGYAWYELYRLDMDKTKYNRAKSEYEKVLQVDKNFSLAYRGLADLLAVSAEELNEHDAKVIRSNACTSYQKAADLDPKDWVLFDNWGYTLQRLDQYVESETKYLSAIALKSDFAHAYDNLGTLYDKLGRYEEAQVQFKRAAQADQCLSDTYGDWCRMLTNWPMKPDYGAARDTVLGDFLKTVHEARVKSVIERLSDDKKVATKNCINTLQREKRSR